MTNETTDNVTWVCPDCQNVTVDPADVTALQAAHDALKDENKRLTELLRGDRMVVATRINHEYTKAKGTIRELQAENERLRACRCGCFGVNPCCFVFIRLKEVA